MLETTRLTQPDIFALALDALDAQHIELSSMSPKVWYKRAIFDYTRQQAGRVRHQPRLARTFVRQRLPSMPQIPSGRSAPLELLMSETGRLQTVTEGKERRSTWVKSQVGTSPGQCPLYARKRTCAVQIGMSAKGQKRTFGLAMKQPRLGLQTNTAVRGNITLISVNSPGSVSTSIDPLCCFTMMS
jgi:hypothetical protein